MDRVDVLLNVWAAQIGASREELLDALRELQAQLVEPVEPVEPVAP